MKKELLKNRYIEVLFFLRKMIPGLIRHFEFISPEEEQNLLEQINEKPWDNSISRRTQHYGYQYPYHNTTNLIPIEPIPDEWDWLSERMIINEYKPGQGIAPHIDHIRHFKSPIISLSLGSATTFVFTRNNESISVRP
jgi:hypothetical protein